MCQAGNNSHQDQIAAGASVDGMRDEFEPSQAGTGSSETEQLQSRVLQLTCDRNRFMSLWKKQKQKIDELRQKLRDKEAEIRRLKQQIYGKNSEQRVTGSESAKAHLKVPKRPRGQQRGRAGHGRTDRSGLERKTEWRDVDAAQRSCRQCGLSYGVMPHTEDSEILEVAVKAHVRKVRRKVYVRRCQCASATPMVSALPAPRLIPKSGIGVSVWEQVLTHKYLYGRPLNSLCQQYRHWGMTLSAGTLTGGLKQMASKFAPLLDSWLERQRSEALVHYDETGWPVHEPAGKRWWLWVSKSSSVVYFVVAPSRSSQIPIRHLSDFSKHLSQVIVVCDRWGAYKRCANKVKAVDLAYCWSHVRRDYLAAATKMPELESWMLAWVNRIGELYQLNKKRLPSWDASLEISQQDVAFRTHHEQLTQALDDMQQTCERELAQPDLATPQRKTLKSLNRHWDGLTLFLQHPQVPLDNNIAERLIRPAAVGRKNYYGSGAPWSAELAALLFSVLQTVLLWEMNPHRWLHEYLSACAENGGEAPADRERFTPWCLDDRERQQLSKPWCWQPP